jgi:hypothetical protein
VQGSQIGFTLNEPAQGNLAVRVAQRLAGDRNSGTIAIRSRS